MKYIGEIKMEIFYITGSLPPINDGVADWSECLISELKNEHDLKVFKTKKMNSLEEVEEIYIENFRSNNLLKHIKNDVDFVHIEYPCVGYGKYNFKINLLPMLLKLKKNKIKISLMLHEFDSYTLKGKLRCLMMIWFSDHIFTSDSVNKAKIEKLTSKKVKKLLIKSQLPVEKKDYSISKNDDIILGFWGYIREDKGFDLILEVVNILLKNNYNIKFRVLSDLDPNIEYHKKLLKRIDDLNLKNKLEIHGFLDNSKMSEEINKLDICILPYKKGLTERRGTFMAPMANGCCVITIKPRYKIEGLIHKNNVVYCNYNYYSIIEELKYLLNNIDEIKEIGNNASIWYDNLSKTKNSSLLIETIKEE